MRKVKFSKLTRDVLEAMQNLIAEYIDSTVVEYLQDPELYFQGVLQGYVCRCLWRMFRTKLEGEARLFSFSLNPDQAVILLTVLHAGFKSREPGSFTHNIAVKYQNLIDQQIKSFNYQLNQPTHHEL